MRISSIFTPGWLNAAPATLFSLSSATTITPKNTLFQTQDQQNMATTAFDKSDARPAHIDAILNGLDRYNPETTTVFQDYVVQQCEDRTFDCYANLALLKLYVYLFFFLSFAFLISCL